jgi:hypothetical protein
MRFHRDYPRFMRGRHFSSTMLGVLTWASSDEDQSVQGPAQCSHASSGPAGQGPSMATRLVSEYATNHEKA